MHFVNSDGAQFIVLSLILPGSQNLQISKGDSLQMRLGNRSLVTLTAHGDAVPAPFISPGQPGYRQLLSSYIPEYSCSAEDLRMIAAAPLTALRIYFGATPVTLEKFRDKHLQQIMAAANCIAQ